jgi:GxxExxY protein
MRIAKARKGENTKGAASEMGHTFEALSGKIIEAAIDVHRQLGPGFLESIYDSALRVALRHRGIIHDSQKDVAIIYEGEEVGTHRLDLLVEDQIVVELKAVRALEDVHFAQVRSYLKATHVSVGLLLNFNAPTLVVKRVILSESQPGDDSTVGTNEQDSFSSDE